MLEYIQMLICYRYTSGNTAIRFGLAIKQWKIDGEPRIYILVPQDAKHYCEVEIIYPPEYEWGFVTSKDGNIVFDSPEVDNSKCPRLDKASEQNLYFVWDDGASKHLEQAAALYAYFKRLIDENRELALKTKERLFDEEYHLQLKEAKAKGWDSSLITVKVPLQAYGAN